MSPKHAAAALCAFPLLLGAEEGQTILVHLGDGTSVPLRSWTFSYEYASWPRGESPLLGSTARRDTLELWSGKRALPVTGLSLEVQYKEEEREREVEGEQKKVKVTVPRGLALLAPDGKRSAVKPEPPHSDLLAPGSEGRVVAARSLDLRGESIVGTRREFCLASYSALVECAPEPGQRVMRIDFRP